MTKQEIINYIKAGATFRITGGIDIELHNIINELLASGLVELVMSKAQKEKL